MCARRVPAIAALIVAIAVTVASAQDWRAAGLAAFDEVWQTIQETDYDPTFGGVDWVAVGRELRPRAAAATSPEALRAIVREMIGRLGRSHFALLAPTPGAPGAIGGAIVPFDVRVTQNDVLVTRVHDGADVAVRPGDAILQIDAQDVTRLIDGTEAGDPRRADLAWRRVMHVLSSDTPTPVRLRLRDPSGAERSETVARVPAPGTSVTVGNLPPLRASVEVAERRTRTGRRVGVIRFSVWMATLSAAIDDAVDRFRTVDGLVIDLRGNPGGLADMIRGVAGHLVDAPVVLGRAQMRELTLTFRANPRRSTADGRTVVPYGGPVAVLVDERTASASECFAGGLQAIGRVRVFGTRTAGQALPAVTRRLANGDVLMYAVGDFVTSTGRRLEGIGVEPDEVVPTDAAMLATGHDAESAALAWIDGVSPR